MARESTWLWLEAEHFSDKGGWFVDTQFVQQMGSACLLAAGTLNPVADARTRITVPHAARYRLWVRTRDWLPDHSPGRFEVHVNGRRASTVFGEADTDDWTWQNGGTFDLCEGAASVALHDLTGHFGRCDALLFTSDLTYVPPAGGEELARERRRLRGIAEAAEDAGERFDVVVIGAGPGGCPAAVAAARLGAKVAVVHDRPIIGGNGSDEIRVPFNGAAPRQTNAREGGIAEEIARLRAFKDTRGYTAVLEELFDEEPSITVFLNKRVLGVEKENETTLAAVNAVDTLEGTLHTYRGRLFIDATGDAWAGYFAGARYLFGREAKSDYGESMAADRADNVTMSGCVRGPFDRPHIEETDRPVSYTPPPWACKLPPEEEFGRIMHKPALFHWWVEHAGDLDDMQYAEKARDELIRIEYGIWDYVKNIWSGRAGAANYALRFIPFINGRREGMRLVGDYVLKQQDAEQGIDFPDTVAHTGWPIDVHHPKGIFSGKEGPFQSNTQVALVKFPYRCLYSANIDNLMMAGRNVSVTHVALGTTRVQSTIATFGQAAGTAAALCLKHETTPRGIYQHHLEELQQTLLKHDQYIPGRKNEDAADIARRARSVTASSVAENEICNMDQGQDAELVPLDTSRASLIPREVTPRIPALHLRLCSERSEPVQLTLRVRGTRLPWDFSSEQDLAQATAVVPPNRESWVEFPVACTVAEDYVWVWLPATEGIFWRRRVNTPLDCQLAYGGGDGTDWVVPPRHQNYAVMMHSPASAKANCGACNVINGYSRILDAGNYMWVSDPGQALPQWIEVALDKPQTVSSVFLTFDTDMNNPPAAAANPPRVPQCVRDYQVACRTPEGWMPVAEVSDNILRHRIHRFRPLEADRVRLIVTATNGAPSARVFEIRLYAD